MLIIRLAAKAPRRRRPLSSNVRPQDGAAVSLEAQLQVLSWVVGLASLLTLAIPVWYFMGRPGTFLHRGVLAAGTFALSWTVPLLVFLLIVMPCLYGNEFLARATLSSPEPSNLLRLLRWVVRSVNSYWYIAGQVVLPVTAALAAYPIARYVAHRSSGSRDAAA